MSIATLVTDSELLQEGGPARPWVG
jgi:hypothetical protein